MACFSGYPRGYKTHRVVRSDSHACLSVVSIPIFVLRGSLLNRSTKFGLEIFLCLSIFMAICDIVRMTGYYYKGPENDIWEFFWQQTEGAVAVMMASITAFRTLLVKRTADSEATVSRSPVESFFHRFFRRFQSLAPEQPGEKPSATQNGPILKLPKLPLPIFTGLRTFIRKNNRTDASAATFATLVSVSLGPGTDYHVALKAQTRAASGSASSHG